MRSRAGGRLLALFGAPLNTLILRAHADCPLRLKELHERLGSSQSTLREYLASLISLGALRKHDLERSPPAVATGLTEAGWELLRVADVFERWLAQAPDGPIALDSEQGKGAVKALAAGWDSNVLGALAARPLSLTELDGLIDGLSYPALERRLAAMRARRQIEALPDRRTETLYTVTGWVRQAFAPLAAASSYERRRLLSDSELIWGADLEAAFLLALPLITLPLGVRGACLLLVDAGDGGDVEELRTGVRGEVEGGCVAAAVPISPIEDADSPCWIRGSSLAWLDAIVEGDPGQLQMGGPERRLPLCVVQGFHDAFSRHQ
jgi:DNA-binding HxlR family transcriptional regulator